MKNARCEVKKLKKYSGGGGMWSWKNTDQVECEVQVKIFSNSCGQLQLRCGHCGGAGMMCPSRNFQIPIIKKKKKKKKKN